MSSPFLARLMVTAVAAGQGIVPLFIDLGRTHATNPLWLGHARFHVVWQTFALTLASVVEVAMIWWIAPDSRVLFYLATLLTGLPITGFLIATFTRALYGGTLHDPNGIHPARIRWCGRIHEVDINLVLVGVGAVVLAIAAAIF